MELYQGVKFHCRSTGSCYAYDGRLTALNNWSWHLSQLGLAPVHQAGAYGNVSYRSQGPSFIISRSGMIPQRELDPAQYTLVHEYDPATATFLVCGCGLPSSESFLHERIYHSHPEVGAILHGHSLLLNEWAEALQIPVTRQFYAYGTAELAASALAVISAHNRLIILKEHGFVAVGRTIAEAGRLVLGGYRDLLRLLEAEIGVDAAK